MIIRMMRFIVWRRVACSKNDSYGNLKVPCFMALHARNTSSISRTTAKPQADVYALSSRIGNICVRRLCLKDSYRRIVEDIVQQCLASDERNLAPIKRKICHTA